MKNYVSFAITIGVVPKWFKGPVCKTVIRRFESGRRLFFEKFFAWVVELVDTTDLKSVGSNTVPVRVRPRVQRRKGPYRAFFRFCTKLLRAKSCQVCQASPLVMWLYVARICSFTIRCLYL